MWVRRALGLVLGVTLLLGVAALALAQRSGERRPFGGPGAGALGMMGPPS